MSSQRKEDIVTVEKSTRIRYKDRMIDYPFQKNIHQLDKEEFIDCLYGLFETRSREYSSFKEMLYSKFGKGIAEKFLIPYNTKLYACDLDLLDKDAMGRFFPYADREEIIRNFRNSDNKTYNGTFIYSRKGAMSFVRPFLDRLDPSRIRYNVEVKKIFPSEKKVLLSDGTVVEYDRLVSTVPFPKLLDMCGMEYDRSIYSCNQVLVFNIGFDRKGPDRTDHWIYFPGDEYCFYRVGFYDNILGQDRTSVYVELGFPQGVSPDPQAIFPSVIKDLEKAGITDPSMELVDYETILMNPAYVHITGRSEDDVKLQKERLQKYDIYSIGRYGSWTYCSIEDNILEARSLANKLNLL